MIRKTKCIFATTFPKGCVGSVCWSKDFSKTAFTGWYKFESGSWTNTWEKSRDWRRGSR